MTSDVGHSRRFHPTCPKCGYDLVATLSGSVHRCPECGGHFSPDEVSYVGGQGDWTLKDGLRRAAISLAARIMIASAVRAAATLLLLWITSNALVHYRLIACMGVLAGIPVGIIIWRNLEDHAGFSSQLLAAIACIAIITAIIIATLLTEQYIRPLAQTSSFVWPGAGIIIGCAVVIRGYLTGD